MTDPVQTVRSYLDHLSVERGAAANTLSSYRRDLRRYLGYLAQQGIGDLEEVGEQTIAGFLAHLREGDDEHQPLGASSAARALVAVRGFHRFAVADGVLDRDPARGVRPPAPVKRLPKALPLSDVEAILAAAGSRDTVLAVRDRALLELLYGTGARISEAVGLDVDDLDPVSASVLLRGKGGKERLVPVGSYALAAVQAYLSRSRPTLATGAGAAPTAPCSSTPGAVGCPGRAPGRSWSERPSEPGSPAMCRHTRCGTPLPRTCSKGEPMSGWCKSCWVTPR